VKQSLQYLLRLITLAGNVQECHRKRPSSSLNTIFPPLATLPVVYLNNQLSFLRLFATSGCSFAHNAVDDRPKLFAIALRDKAGLLQIITASSLKPTGVNDTRLRMDGMLLSIFVELKFCFDKVELPTARSVPLNIHLTR